MYNNYFKRNVIGNKLASQFLCLPVPLCWNYININHTAAIKILGKNSVTLGDEFILQETVSWIELNFERDHRDMGKTSYYYGFKSRLPQCTRVNYLLR